MSSRFKDHLFRNRSASQPRMLADTFADFCQKFNNNFLLIDSTGSAPANPYAFSYRLFQDRSGVALVSHVRSSAAHLLLRAQAQEIGEEAVFLLCTMEGELTVESGKHRIVLPKGALTVFSAGFALTIDTTAPSDWMLFLFPKDYFFTHTSFLSPKLYGHIFSQDMPAMKLIFNVLREMIKVIPKLNNEEVENTLDGFCGFLRAAFHVFLRQYFATHASSDHILERTDLVLNRHIRESDLRLDQVAAEVGLSKRYLARLFAAEGETVMRRLKTMRLQRAATMLREKHLAHDGIADIAVRCGFKNASHFSREFRSYFGEQPSDYRARNVLNRTQK